MVSSFPQSVFTAGGTVGALMQSLDWSASPLGAPDTWPQSLVSTLSICLSTRFPIAICWGPEYIFFYNDAWIALEGKRHPASLGRPIREVRRESWEFLAPGFDPRVKGFVRLIGKAAHKVGCVFFGFAVIVPTQLNVPLLFLAQIVL